MRKIVIAVNLIGLLISIALLLYTVSINRGYVVVIQRDVRVALNKAPEPMYLVGVGHPSEVQCSNVIAIQILTSSKMLIAYDPEKLRAPIIVDNNFEEVKTGCRLLQMDTGFATNNPKLRSFSTTNPEAFGVVLEAVRASDSLILQAKETGVYHEL